MPAAVPAALPSKSTVAAKPSAENEAVPWPKALLDACFAAQRARIEAPFRRVLSSKGSGFNSADCMNIIEAAKQMKVLLGQIAVQISEEDRIEAANFLDQLAAQARSILDPKQVSGKPF
jgi:hypothetical protein